MKLLQIVTSKKFSFLCFFVGVIWFLSLSQFELNQATYMSENALLVGLIKQQFNNHSALNYFYKELHQLFHSGNSENVKEWLKETMESFGLDVGVHNYTFKYDKLLHKQQFEGQSVYGIIRSPGAARMQAILITAPLRYGGDNSPDNQPLLASAAVMLALAQFERYKLYWATDIIFLFTEMEYIGLKAWLNAYHGLTDSNEYIVSEPLSVRSGSILASFNLEISTARIAYLECRVEGLNGQLANLDLFNAVARLAQAADVPVRIHGVTPPTSNSITSRRNGLRSYMSMMWHQSSGSPSGLHGLLADYQVPALTVYSPSDHKLTPRTNLFDLTRLMESALRSINGLQERMHQSFFFYLLPSPMTYVSIGVYMIPFGVMCGCALIGQVIFALRHFQMRIKETVGTSHDEQKRQQEEILDWWSLGVVTIMSLGVGFFSNYCVDHILIHCHYFKIEPSNALLFGAVAICVAVIIFCKLKVDKPTNDCIILLKAALNLGLGLFLGTLSVLNISMAFFFAVVVVPAALFTYPYRNRLCRLICKFFLIAICPLCLVFLSALIHNSYFSNNKFLWKNSELYKESFISTRNWLIQGWTERDVLGSWTVNIFNLCYLPLWVMMWCIARMSPVVVSV